MIKSKWNCGKTIPVSMLDSEELKDAIHEWAENDDVLEELLWLCYKNGVETVGCDAGDHHFAYIDLALRSERGSLCKILNSVLKMKRCSIIFSFNGNPRSGPLWYEPHFSICPSKRSDVRLVYSKLCFALKKPWGRKPSEVSKQLFNIADFLKDKESGLIMKLNKTEKGYLFFFECLGNSRNWEYFTKLFETAGLNTMENKKPNIPLKTWGINTSNLFELDVVLRSVYDTMRLKWDLALPEEFTSDMDFNSMALMMRRKFGTDEIGTEKLYEWVRNNWGKPFNEITY